MTFLNKTNTGWVIAVALLAILLIGVAFGGEIETQGALRSSACFPRMKNIFGDFNNNFREQINARERTFDAFFIF